MECAATTAAGYKNWKESLNPCSNGMRRDKFYLWEDLIILV